MDTRELLTQTFERFNDRENRAGFFAAYAEDVTLHGYAEGLEGLDGVRRFHEELWLAFPDLELRLADVVIEDDRAALRYELRGTHRRTYLGVPSGGRPIAVQGMLLLRLADGRIVEEWHAATELSILRQLGAMGAITAAGARFSGPARRSASADAAALRLEELEP